MRIKALNARQVLNAKGLPTIEIVIATHKNIAISSVPLAASKSKYEFFDSFDSEIKSKSQTEIESIIDNINRVVAPELIGKRSMDQEDLDNLILDIDQTYDRSKLGVNAIAALSQAITKLGALESDLELFKYIRVLYDFSDHTVNRLLSDYSMPLPVITVFKAGSHDKSNDLPLQEIMLLPERKFSYLVDLIPLFSKLHHLKINSTDTTLKTILLDIKKQSEKLKLKTTLGVDLSASRFKREEDNSYVIHNFDNRKAPFKGSFDKLLQKYLEIIETSKLTFVEDLFDEDEYAGWNELLNKSYKKDKSIQIVSDDFTATNLERLEKIALLESANNVVVKPTQAGTISEVIHFAARANKLGLNTTVSYRFGETEDTFISDLSVGIGAKFIRTGYFLGSENNAKLNRLIHIENSL